MYKGLTLKSIYGRELFDIWYKMTTMLRNGLDISPVLSHAFPIDAFQSGKVILDWD